MSGLVKSVGTLATGLVGGLLGQKKATAAPTPPPAPTVTPVEKLEKPPTVEDATVTVREKEDEVRRRKGRAATILTGEKGAGTPSTAAKTLLGE